MIRALTLYFFLLLSHLISVTAQAATGQIKLQTLPSLDSVYPLSVPVRIVLSNSGAVGKTLEGTRFHIRLYAPPPGRFLSTDYPLVEKTLLIEMDFVAAQGRAIWEYVFPIRGVYRLEVATLNRTGKEVTAIFPLRIRENKTKLLYLGIFVVFLFLFGVTVGRLFTARSGRNHVRVGLLLLMSALSLASVMEEEAMARQYGGKEILTALEISPPTVGQPSKIHWSLSERKTGKPLPSRLTLAITHLEKGKRIFFLERIPTEGVFNLSFHFTDASRHRISSTAEVEGGRLVQAEKIVTVSSENPPQDVAFRTLFLFLIVLGLGLVTGRISRRWKR